MNRTILIWNPRKSLYHLKVIFYCVVFAERLSRKYSIHFWKYTHNICLSKTWNFYFVEAPSKSRKRSAPALATLEYSDESGSEDINKNEE